MQQIFIAAPVAVVILVITIGATLFVFSNEAYFGKWMLRPYDVSRGKNYYTLLTSALIHKDWMHLFFNVFSFVFFAFRLEQNLGHWQFGVLYILSMVLSDIPSVIKHKDDPGYRSLGASGAVSAVVFGSILFDPLSTITIMVLPIPMPAYVFGVLYLVYCHFASKQARDHVNHDAHLFGALSGIVITIILHPSVLHDFIGSVSGAIGSHFH
jgi:membrane associated rhomboid family serine protease